MESIPRLFLRIGGEIRGPYQPEQLHHLVDGGVIAPTTEAAESATGPWVRLESLPCKAVLFPPRPELRFKAATFEIVNRETTPPPPDSRELVALAARPPPGVAAAPSTTLPAAPSPEPPNEIAEMVREVARLEERLAPPPVFVPGPRLRKRTQHYLIATAASNAGLAGIVLWYGSWSGLDDMSRLIFGGWCTLYNGGLAYIMLVLTPRY